VEPRVSDERLQMMLFPHLVDPVEDGSFGALDRTRARRQSRPQQRENDHRKPRTPPDGHGCDRAWLPREADGVKLFLRHSGALSACVMRPRTIAELPICSDPGCLRARPRRRRPAAGTTLIQAGRSSAWLERVLWEHEAAGSNPAVPIRSQDRTD